MRFSIAIIVGRWSWNDVHSNLSSIFLSLPLKVFSLLAPSFKDWIGEWAIIFTQNRFMRFDHSLGNDHEKERCLKGVSNALRIRWAVSNQSLAGFDSFALILSDWNSLISFKESSVSKSQIRLWFSLVTFYVSYYFSHCVFQTQRHSTQYRRWFQTNILLQQRCRISFASFFLHSPARVPFYDSFRFLCRDDHSRFSNETEIFNIDFPLNTCHVLLPFPDD